MQNIYISPEGNDQFPGTAEQPFQSLDAARLRVRKILDDQKEDITVQLSSGIHRLTKTLVLGAEDGGDDRVSVIWKGSEEGETILSSGYPLEGWQRCTNVLPDIQDTAHGKVWYTDLPSGTKVNTLYSEDGPIPRARGNAIKPQVVPAENKTSMYGPDGPIKTSAGKPNRRGWTHEHFCFAAGAITPATDLHEAEFLIIPVNQWTMNILPLGKIDFDRRIVTLAKPCTYPIGVPHCAPEGSIWLENSLSVLSPGSWVYHAETSRLYYYPESEEPEAGLEASCLTEFIRVEGVHDLQGEQNPVQGLHFENLTFTRSNRYAFHGLTGKGIQHDWEMHDASTCMLRLRHARNCSVLTCKFHQGGSGGLRMDLACRDNLVEGCTFAHLGGCGVVLCGYGLSRHYLNRGNRVLHNHFHHLGEHYWHCPAVFIWQSGDNHISENHLHDLPYTAIVCSGRSLYDREGVAECSATIHWDDVEAQCGKGYVHNVWHYSGLPSWWMREPLMHSRENLIEYNYIHDVMQTMGDGNGIYISGAGGGNVVRFNVVGPCTSSTMAEGIRCDDDQHHTILHGNLIFAQGGHATGITLKGINRVTNNILALPHVTPLRGMLSLETGPLNGSVIQRNIIYTSAPEQTFVSEIRIHGQGRKARLCDTDSDENIYYCASDTSAGKVWLERLQSYGTDRHSLCCDPGFVDAENGDFNLKADAAALTLGFLPLPLTKMMQNKR